MQQVQFRLYTRVQFRLYALVSLAYFLWQKWFVMLLIKRSMMIAMLLVIIVGGPLLTSSPGLEGSYSHESYHVAWQVEGPGGCCP
jgi:hypothetical protein